MLLATLGTSSANIALPALATNFGASFQAVQWVVIVYLLAITCSVVSWGRWGDVVGRRRLLQAGLLLFTVASLMSGCATSLWLLIAARAVQGLGGAALMALTVALVSELVPKERTGAAMGLLGTTSAMGTALGPSVGGVLLQLAGWPALFLANVPLGLLALGLSQRYLPADRVNKTAAERFDHLGTALLTITLISYSLALTLGRGRWGALNVALLLASAVGLLLFIQAERRAAAPLLRLSLLRDPALSIGLASSLLVSSAVMVTLVVGPFYLTQARHLAPGAVGLLLAVGPLVAAATGLPAGRLVDRFGTERAALAGLGALAAGYFTLALALEAEGAAGIWGYVLPLAVATAGYALFQAANNTAVMRDVSPNERGVLSGALSLSRNLGLIAGACVLGAVFALAAGTSDITTATAAAVAHAKRVAFAVAGALAAGTLGVVAVAHGFAQIPQKQGEP